MWANSFDTINIITSEQNTQVDELVIKLMSNVVSHLKYEVCRPLTWSIVSSKPSKTFSKMTSLIGIFFCSENVRCRNKIGEENVIVSISSEAAAYTLFAFAKAAHWASASHGAYSSGTSWLSRIIYAYDCQRNSLPPHMVFPCILTVAYTRCYARLWPWQFAWWTYLHHR
jgi:hypothetical protein